ncbi:MAG TPA: YciI family protein [Gemmatimonadales bacterium]|nr:YciI family protein [Gemmatimonadales bacterium]
MRFLMMVKADERNSGPPTPELAAGIQKLVEEVKRSGGELLQTGGLLPSAMGARIRAGRGKLTVTDGPFTEGKELVGGYAIFRFDSKQQAIEQGKRFMQLHIDVLGPSYQGELEIRQLMDGPHD